MRLIDADALMWRLATWSADLALTYGENDEYVKCLDSVCGMIEGAESIEVVRCKDCKNWDTSWISNDGFYYCPMIDRLTPGDFFCADGERREDA